ncbi:NAD(P)-dependent dehydrogenase (short-subunit alcohol dehydrogenase family) [Tepidamorphus gemmatus]|uniref:NAD(P)-dependent dehydrogenase (Short-subunit alcohol dehydrogenase family) n=1 Tax=Tepidamorphus gemmatus TaxID=747076 RepID=A0A4R3MKS9_9HYPH|nr:SDR family oxidoreductase [Tepidamorphus gemmatus]TCT12450.1 NAD(P)-dependent dehydrogenase (short-subunit alcohol dehydrogenase family) [Tepidamorphus gemmatus]
MDGLFDLTGKTALVIGGSDGIGRELAQGLAGAGAAVLLSGRDPERLRMAADLLPARSTGPTTYACDARDVGQLSRLCAAVWADHGRIDILVNCQGVTAIKPALDISEPEYDAILDTNLKSTFFACTRFGARMIAAGGGTIINIASLAAHTGWDQAAAYSASKWGVVGLTKSLAWEWGELGVRVNAIAPGFFLTDLNRDRMSADRKARAGRRAAMRRMGELRELVGAAIYLASPASGFVTGSVLCVDGGYLASGI